MRWHTSRFSRLSNKFEVWVSLVQPALCDVLVRFFCLGFRNGIENLAGFNISNTGFVLLKAKNCSICFFHLYIDRWRCLFNWGTLLSCRHVIKIFSITRPVLPTLYWFTPEGLPTNYITRILNFLLGLEFQLLTNFIECLAFTAKIFFPRYSL